MHLSPTNQDSDENRGRETLHESINALNLNSDQVTVIYQKGKPVVPASEKHPFLVYLTLEDCRINEINHDSDGYWFRMYNFSRNASTRPVARENTSRIIELNLDVTYTEFIKAMNTDAVTELKKSELSTLDLSNAWDDWGACDLEISGLQVEWDLRLRELFIDQENDHNLTRIVSNKTEVPSHDDEGLQKMLKMIAARGWKDHLVVKFTRSGKTFQGYQHSFDKEKVQEWK